MNNDILSKQISIICEAINRGNNDIQNILNYYNNKINEPQKKLTLPIMNELEAINVLMMMYHLYKMIHIKYDYNNYMNNMYYII
ncbi:MAG TPA: hypothetical protein PKG96_04345 [Bacilli bacterium]|jgi:hypothetical protein|nr:hypothetical protein [Bacilli bacterium]